MSGKKLEFEVEVKGKKLKLAVRRPDLKAQQAGQVAYAVAYSRLLQQKCILREALHKHAREQNVWDDEKQAALDEIEARIAANQRMLPGPDGKVKTPGVTKAKARAAAIQLRRDRFARLALLRDFHEMEKQTVEGQAETEKFNTLVAACTVYAETGNPYFESTEDFLSRADDDAVFRAAEKFAELYYGVEAEEDLPENKFLLGAKLCRPGDLHLTDPNGNTVDEAGNRVAADEVADAEPTYELTGDDWLETSEAAVSVKEEGAATPSPEEKEAVSPAADVAA